MRTSLGLMAIASMSSLLAVATCLILTGLSITSDLPTVTVSVETTGGEDSAAFCAGAICRIISQRETTVRVLAQLMRKSSAGSDFSFSDAPLSLKYPQSLKSSLHRPID